MNAINESTAGTNQVQRRCCTIIFAVFFTAVLNASPLLAARWSPAAPTTYSQELSPAEAVVIAKYHGPVNYGPVTSDSDEADEAWFEVVQVIKGDFLIMRPRQIKAATVRMPDKDELFVMAGVKPPDLTWNVVSSASSTLTPYLVDMSRLPNDDVARLKFFVSHLENEDPHVAEDALMEVGEASIHQLARLELDRMQLLTWIENPELTGSRRALYFRMLGVCGTAEDLPMLEAAMNAAHANSRSAGLYEVIASYLVLRGAAGLPFVEDRFLRNKDVDYVSMYSAIQALRYHVNRHDVIAKEAILKAMRLVLDWPTLADLVVADLARWEDWSVMEQLFSLCVEADTKEEKWIRVPVINYLRRCPLDKARAYIAELEEIDPEAVRRARLFFPDPR